MADIFISYSHDDTEYASALEKALKEQFNIWTDRRIEGGKFYRAVIQEELDNAKCVIVIWSKSSKSRGWVLDEADHAYKKGTYFPILASSEIELPPIGLRQIQACTLKYDFKKKSFNSEQFQQLHNALCAKLESVQSDFIVEITNKVRTDLEKALKFRYKIIQELGRGSTSIFFKARSVEVQAEYTIRVNVVYNMLLEQNLFDAYRAASKDSSVLRHPNIVSIHNAERHEELMVLVTRFIDGVSLDSVLRDRNADNELPIDDVLLILSQVASALAHAHRKGIVHGNLKPSKILIDKTGNAFVSHFNVIPTYSKFKGRKKQSSLATPKYISPEHCKNEGEITALSDQYSFGIIAYNLLAGEYIYEGKSDLEILNLHASDNIEYIKKIDSKTPKAFRAILKKLLSKKPSQRYRTMKLVLNDLQNIVLKASTYKEEVRFSFKRCCLREDFLDLFYDKFIGENQEVKEVFEKNNIDFDEQIKKLHKALDFIVCSLDSEFREQMKELNKKHYDLNLNKNHFKLFKKALLDTVSICEKVEGPRKDKVLKSWEKLLDACNKKMGMRYD